MRRAATPVGSAPRSVLFSYLTKRAVSVPVRPAAAERLPSARLGARCVGLNCPGDLAVPTALLW